MTLAFPSPEFDNAIAAVCHGLTTEAEARALNELLRTNPTARDEYLLRVELHARLASEPDLFSQSALTSPTPLDAPDAWRLKSPAPNEVQSLPAHRRMDFPPSEFPGPTQRPSAASIARTDRRKLVLALAACLVLGAAGIGSLWFKRSAARNGATSKAVAMLTRVVDARWSPGVRPPRVGGALEPGLLRLESGLAQVVFYRGARVVIEGPAEVRIVSPDEAVCATGRLLAEVPAPARGFRLRTGQLNVVDRGTAFGIDTTQGRTEVHVFKGEVELLPGTAPKQSLGEGRAAVVQGNARPEFMAASTAAFTPMFEFQQRSLASEAYRFEQWQFASAQLNQDPAVVARFDFEDLNGADWTLRNAAGRNRSVSQATIVGCQRAEGRWREKQALEFQSVNDRVRLAVPGDFEALTISLWVCVKGLDRQFNSLFMCDGFEPRTIHWLIRNDGVLGLTLFGSGAGNFEILASPPALALDKLGTWLHLAVVLDGRGRQAVQYVNGVPIARHALKLGPPFRLGAAELGNWNGRSGPNPAPFLIRNLSGSLDEFVLFSRALNDDEVRDLYAKGKPDL